MSGEVQAVKQMPPKSLGDNLIIAGQQIAAMGAANSVFCPTGYMGGFGGFGGPIFAVPGFDAADIYARQKLSDIMFGNCGNTTNSAGTTTGGVTDAATANAKTTNPADPFSKIKYKKIEEMAQKEEAIKAKEKEVNDEEDAERKEALSKELVQLQNEYRKLDAQLGNGSQLSKTFGDKEFSFYSNIQPKEYQTIGEINAEIGKMKEALAKLEKEGVDLANEREQVRAQLRSKAGMFSTIDDQTVLNNMSPEKRDRYYKVKKEREDLIKQIEGKIGELKSYISDEVLKDDNDNNNFYTSVVGQRTKEKEEAKKQEGDNIAKVLDDMYGADGKLKDEGEILKQLEGIVKNKYQDTERKAVVKRLHALAEKSKTKEKFKKALEEKDFFAQVSTIDLDDKNIEKSGKELALLQEVYDKIIDSGKFKANYEKYRKEDPNFVKIPWTSIESAIKRANKSSGSSSSSGKTEGEENSSIKEAEAKADADAKRAAEEAGKAAEAQEKANAEGASDEDKRAAEEARKAAEEARKKAEESEKALTARREEYRRSHNIHFANAVLSTPTKNNNGQTKCIAKNVPITAESIKKGGLLHSITDIELIDAISNGTLKLEDFRHDKASQSKYLARIIRRLNDFAEKAGHNKRITFEGNFWSSNDIFYEEEKDGSYSHSVANASIADKDLGGACGSSKKDFIKQMAKDLLDKINAERVSLGYDRL